MKNFAEGSPFASARIGEGEAFVSEVDESDGSIAFFEPRVAVVNNVSLDHKSLDELRSLFRGFIATADSVVLNLDNAETAALSAGLKPERTVTYSLGWRSRAFPRGSSGAVADRYRVPGESAP